MQFFLAYRCHKMRNSVSFVYYAFKTLSGARSPAVSQSVRCTANTHFPGMSPRATSKPRRRKSPLTCPPPSKLQRARSSTVSPSSRSQAFASRFPEFFRVPKPLGLHQESPQQASQTGGEGEWGRSLFFPTQVTARLDQLHRSIWKTN